MSPKKRWHHGLASHPHLPSAKAIHGGIEAQMRRLEGHTAVQRGKRCFIAGTR